MASNTGVLENSLKRPDRYDIIDKKFLRKYRLLGVRHNIKTRDSSGIFKTNYSITNGSDVTASNVNSLPLKKSYFVNDNKTYVRVLTNGKFTDYLNDNNDYYILDNNDNRIITN